MVCSSASEILFISVNQSVTMMGKAWLIVMLFLRALVLLLAGYPLYQDEQERFVCNTIQPGCANVCYDHFSPISLFRFWLVQLITLSLPMVIFIIYVVHKVTNAFELELHNKLINLAKIQQLTLTKNFTGAYFLQLLFRMLLEAGFGAAHYYFFGFYIPKRYLCQHSPCTTQVDCYISRPTEKTVMLNFMLAMGALSIFLNVLDFFCTVKRSVRQKNKRKLMMEKICEEEQISAKGNDQNITENNGSFRKRHGSKSSNRGEMEKTNLERPSRPCSPNANGNNGCNQEVLLERQGSDVALCPPGTPRSIRVSKRSRLKPPPPPRRENTGDLPVPVLDVSTTTAAKKVGAFAIVAGIERQPSEEEKRSEWV